MNELAQISKPAHEEVQSLPEYIRLDVIERLGQLSHAGLLGQETNPSHESAAVHRDTVSRQLHAASILFTRAHDILSTPTEDGTIPEVFYNELARKAIDIATQDAQKAHQEERTEEAITYMESVLVLHSLAPDDTSESTSEQSQSLVRNVVSVDLTDELITATHRTFGLVANPVSRPTPLNSLAINNSAILRASSTIEFDDDFSNINDRGYYGKPDGLSLIDAVAVDKALSLRHETTAREQVVSYMLRDTNAFINLCSSGSRLDAPMYMLTAAHELGMDDPLQKILTGIRRSRFPGLEIQKRQDHKMIQGLDALLATVARSGDVALASEMLSASSSEPHNIKLLVAAQTNLSEIEQQSLEYMLIEAQKKKVIDLRKSLEGLLEPDDVTRCLEHFIMPDSLGDVPLVFWQQHNASDIIKDDRWASPLECALAVLAMEKAGVSPAYDAVFYKACLIQEESRKTSYLESAARALYELQNVASRFGLTDTTRESLASSFVDDLDPAAKLDTVITGWETYFEAGGEPLEWALQDIAHHHKPVVAGEQLAMLLHSGFERDIARTILFQGITAKEGIDDLAKKVTTTQQIIKQFAGLGIDTGTISARDLVVEIASRSSGPQEIRQRVYGRLLQSQFEEAYRKCWNWDEYASRHNSIMAQKPSIEDMPLLERMFEELSIDKKLASELFEAWMTRNSIQALYNEKREEMLRQGLRNPNVILSPQDIANATVKQSNVLRGQAEALFEYASRYTTGELETVAKTFGIRNFARYKPDTLHRQLQAWNYGKPPVRILSIAARADHNGAFDNTESEIIRLFHGADDNDIVFFEANNAHDIALAARDVGRREKAHGNTPNVQSVIISAHASPTTLWIGTNGETLDVEDFSDAMLSLSKLPNGRPSRYNSTLGDSYEIILYACSAAKEVPNIKVNIAKAFNIVHGARTQGAPDKPHGISEIRADGTAVFRIRAKNEPDRPMRAQPATIYD